LSIPENKRPELVLKESSLITNELLMSKNSIAIIPSVDLINHRDLFVSSKIAFGFFSELSNTYLYYSNTESKIKKLSLKGDISSNEVILSKILFQEIYNINPEIELDTKENFNIKKNYLIIGNLNWDSDRYKSGISFSEQIADFFEAYYINFLLAANEEKTLSEFHNRHPDLVKTIKNNFASVIEKVSFSDELSEFLIANQDSIEFDFNKMNQESYVEMIKVLYYHQIIEDIFDVKFV
jgi:hypothetical protein